MRFDRVPCWPAAVSRLAGAPETGAIVPWLQDCPVERVYEPGPCPVSGKLEDFVKMKLNFTVDWNKGIDFILQ